MKEKVELPMPTRKRLVLLLQILKSWPDDKITSLDISKATGWKDTLIRHDFWLIGFNCGVSNGYPVLLLKTAICDELNIDNPDNQINKNSDDAVAKIIADSDVRTHSKNICIVGLGRLGSALLDENLVEKSSFSIKAGFDSNVNRVEILRSIYPLYPASEMEHIIKQDKIQYAILTVPDKDAQNMTNRLLKAGIKGIVNMTNIVLQVPSSVKVENISIMNALNLVI